MTDPLLSLPPCPIPPPTIVARWKAHGWAIQIAYGDDRKAKSGSALLSCGKPFQAWAIGRWRGPHDQAVVELDYADAILAIRRLAPEGVPLP